MSGASPLAQYLSSPSSPSAIPPLPAPENASPPRSRSEYASPTSPVRHHKPPSGSPPTSPHVSNLTSLVWALALVAYTWAIAARARLSVGPCDCEAQVAALPALPSRAQLNASACHDPVRWALFAENVSAPGAAVRPLVPPGSRAHNATRNATRSSAGGAAAAATPRPRPAHNRTRAGANVVIRPARATLSVPPLGGPRKFYARVVNASAQPPDREAYITFFGHDDDATGKHPGTFVEAGAGDGLRNSNTRFFAESLGWAGVLVDADARHAASASRRTKQTKWVHGALCAPDMRGKSERFVGKGDFAGLERHMTTSYVHRHSRDWGGGWVGQARTVKCTTLQDVLVKEGVGAVDLLAVEVSGAELAVLQGLDFTKVHVRVAMVALEEREGRKEKSVRELLLERGLCFAKRLDKWEYWVGDEVMKRAHCAWGGLKSEP